MCIVLLNGNWTKDASCPEHRRLGNMFICMHHLVVLWSINISCSINICVLVILSHKGCSINICVLVILSHKGSTLFALSLSSSWHKQLCWVADKAEKGWLVVNLILLPYTLALFIMQLIQTVGHKTATLMFVFLWLSNISFFTNRLINQNQKLLCM